MTVRDGYRSLGVSLMRCNVDPDQHCVQTKSTFTIGHIRRVFLPSHIRPGQAQSAPWWQASDRDGNPVDRPQATRLEAIEVLVIHAAETPRVAEGL